jgi:hypothetical protein
MPGGTEIEWDTSANLLGDNKDTMKKSTKTLINASRAVGLEMNAEKLWEKQ